MRATRLILTLAALSATIIPAQDTPQPLDPTIAPPVLLYREPPVMPELARRHGIQGNVLLKIEITRSGKVPIPVSCGLLPTASTKPPSLP